MSNELSVLHEVLQWRYIFLPFPVICLFFLLSPNLSLFLPLSLLSFLSFVLSSLPLLPLPSFPSSLPFSFRPFPLFNQNLNWIYLEGKKSLLYIKRYLSSFFFSVSLLKAWGVEENQQFHIDSDHSAFNYLWIKSRFIQIHTQMCTCSHPVK